MQAIVTKLVETKLMQLLRFKFGEVYTVSVSAFFGAEAPSHQGTYLVRLFCACACGPNIAASVVNTATTLTSSGLQAADSRCKACMLRSVLVLLVQATCGLTYISLTVTRAMCGATWPSP